MRDTDRDLTSAVVVRADSGIRSLQDLPGRTIGVGAVDSPQATLIPLSYLRDAGLGPTSGVRVRRFDVGVGLHGDHIGGERDAARALGAGHVDAACMTDANLLLFSREGVLPAGSVHVLGRTAPYDHCNMTAAPGADGALVDRFAELLLGMSYADAEVRPLLDLEGLTRWLPGRTKGYALLERAVDELRFYDGGGRPLAADYRP
jgi:ABC-type phosphate/phosphonate transport system substrate-binding protein